MRRVFYYSVFMATLTFVAACENGRLTEPEVPARAFLSGGNDTTCVQGYEGCRLMTSTEQWYYWNLMMDVQDNTNHCQKLKTGLMDAYYGSDPDGFNFVRVYTVQMDPNTNGFVDPEANVIYIREDRFTWGKIYQTLTEEGDHIGNHHVHQQDITWIRNVQGWADAVAKTSIHFDQDIQAECVAW